MTEHSDSRQNARRVLIFLLVFAGLALSLMLLPPPWQTITFVIVIVAALAINRLGAIRWLWRETQVQWTTWQQSRRQTPRPSARLNTTPPPHRQVMLELTVLLFASLAATAPFLPYDPDTRLAGHETEWITGSVHLAHIGLRDTGVIPLWNPYYRSGEPLLDNAVSFVFNPLSSLPALLVGNPQGIKWGIVLNMAFAATGGWFLAYILGFSAASRLLLGLLMLGRGSMSLMMLYGYYQLAVQQAYFPWILAGALAVMRGRSRWAVVLTGVMTALIFMAGNVWYILPVLVMLGVVTLIELFQQPSRYARYKPRRLDRFLARLNLRGLWRMGCAGIITLLVSAVYALPVVTHMDHIGNHDDEYAAGWVITEPLRAPQLYVDPSTWNASHNLPIYVPRDDVIAHSMAQVHYSYTAPLWFVLLLILLIPPLFPALHRPALAGGWRLWLAGLIMLILMTMWGMGGTPLFLWLYDQFDWLRGWRFVGRAMAMGSFWLAVLLVLRFDALWRAIQSGNRPFQGWLLRRSSLILLAAAATVASVDVVSRWYQRVTVVPTRTYVQECLWATRLMHPQREFSVRMTGYILMRDFLTHGIRQWDIESEFLPLPDPNTIGSPVLNLIMEYPQFALPTFLEETPKLEAYGYESWSAGPYVDERFCLWHNPDYAIPYAFTISEQALATHGQWKYLRFHASPAAGYTRIYDTVAVVAEASPYSRLLVASENAYPGWEVLVDDEPAQLQVVGGFVAVELPPSDDYQRVLFRYRPPLLYAGAILTLIGATGSILYLLRLDTRLPFHRRETLPDLTQQDETL